MSHPPAPPDNNFEDPPVSMEQERAGSRIHAAREQRFSRRANGASSGVQTGASCDAQPARLPNPARLPTHTQRV